MTIAEKLAQIKKLVFDTATPPVAGKAKQYKLQDGTPVSISALAAGGDVLINGGPAKAGEYTLKDGTQFTVDENSKITAVTPTAAAKPQSGTPAQPSSKAASPAGDSGDGTDAKDLSEAFKAVKQQLADHQQAFEAYKAYTDKKLAGHDEQMSKHHEALQQMFDVVQKIAKTPTDDAPGATKAKFSFSKVNDRKEMMNRYLQAMDELRNDPEVSGAKGEW